MEPPKQNKSQGISSASRKALGPSLAVPHGVPADMKQTNQQKVAKKSHLEAT